MVVNWVMREYQGIGFFAGSFFRALQYFLLLVVVVIILAFVCK